MADDNKTSDVELQIKLLEKDVISNSEHTARLDTVITHLKDLAESMTKMIAIHEEKHAQHDKTAQEVRDLEGKLERHKDTLHKRISDSEEKICQKIDDKFEKRNEKRDTLEQRVSRLEKAYWMTLGAMALVTFVAGAVKLLV